MNKLYVTHCSSKKENNLQNTSEKVTPDKLYTATPTRRFITRCKHKNVEWAIFSDEYGVWFPSVKHEWYNKDPNTVTPDEFVKLVKDFEEKLKQYDVIYFYHNPGRFHPLYHKLLNTVNNRDKISLITHLYQID